MATSEITRVGGCLLYAVRYHRDQSQFFLELFNKYWPRGADGQSVITADPASVPAICLFYEKLSHHHTMMSWRFQGLLDEYIELVPGSRNYDLEWDGGLPRQ
jgi:hypothetical protein